MSKYTVFTEHDVTKVDSLEDAIEIAQSEYEEGYEGPSGFKAPWIEDENEELVDYDRPGYFIGNKATK